MRDYKFVAQRVLQRRDAYLLAKKRKRLLIWKYTVIPVSLCFLIVTGTVYRHFKENSSNNLQIVEQETTEFSQFDKQETEGQNISDNSIQTEYTEHDTNSVAMTESSQPISQSFSEPKPTTDQLLITETTATSSEIPKEVITTETESSFTTEPTQPITEDNQPEIQQPSDYRITVEAFEPTPEQLSQVVQQTVPSHFEMNYTTLEQLFQDTGATILCKVLSVVNTIRDNKPYTVYTVEVTESVYGSFVAGDLLSIVQYGGYVLQENGKADDPEPILPPVCEESPPPNDAMGPSSNGTDGNDTPAMATPSEILIEEQLAYSETPNVSQEYVLFISPDSLFDGAYATLNQNEGVFKVNPETGELIRNAEQGKEINSVSYETVKEISQYFVDSTN